MTHDEATLFVEKLYRIFKEGDVSELALVYDKALKANNFGYDSNYADLENRFRFMQQHHDDRQFDLKDIIFMQIFHSK